MLLIFKMSILVMVLRIRWNLLLIGIITLCNGGVFGQDTFHGSPIRIPITLSICDHFFSPDKIRLSLVDSLTKVVIKTSIENDANGKSGMFVVNGLQSSRVLSVQIYPNDLLGFEVGHINTDSLLSISRIEVFVNKVEFKNAVGWGLELGKLHNLVQIRLYLNKDNALYSEYLYSLSKQFLPKDIKKVIKKCEILKGELTPRLVLH